MAMRRDALPCVSTGNRSKIGKKMVVILSTRHPFTKTNLSNPDRWIPAWIEGVNLRKNL
jgi:hypothetical protein